MKAISIKSDPVWYAFLYTFTQLAMENTVKIINVTVDELTSIVENAVKKVVEKLPKRRTKPFSKKETRDLFGVSYPTIMRWEKRGFLDRIEVGGRVYYTVESVEKLYASR